jgi:signal transduction histidine kinase
MPPSHSVPTARVPHVYSPDTGGTTYVLLVEDNAADAELLGDYFASGLPDEAPFEVAHVARLGAAIDQVRATRVDLVLLDLSLPDASGLDGVAALAAVAPQVPVVVMTGLADDGMALAAVKAGAQDYLVKGRDGPSAIRRAVRYAIERHRLRREREGLLFRERQARRAAERAARVRDEVLGIVSHDLRNPLSTIVMSARALLHSPDAEAVELGAVIERAGGWALRIIRDLLDVTALEAGKLAIHREPMTVDAIADTLRSLFEAPATDAGVSLSLDLASAPRWVELDVDRVVQAVGNLLANAIKFTPRGGTVALHIFQDGDRVAFRVADNGSGIPAESLPHLFDRFWQAREAHRGGAGLGLAIAKGIAEGHGGRIEVESAVGLGSTFTLVLPSAAGVIGGPETSAQRGG